MSHPNWLPHLFGCLFENKIISQNWLVIFGTSSPIDSRYPKFIVLSRTCFFPTSTINFSFYKFYNVKTFINRNANYELNLPFEPAKNSKIPTKRNIVFILIYFESLMKVGTYSHLYIYTKTCLYLLFTHCNYTFWYFRSWCNKGKYYWMH